MITGSATDPLLKAPVLHPPAPIPLDSIRGIAAVSVILYHISWVNFVEAQAYVRNSYLMVDLFFVLSGFVISYAYGKKIASAPDFLKFMWLRFWRLWPLHFAFLIVFLIIECLKALVQWRFGLIANNPAFSINNFSSFVGNVFLVQSLHIYNDLTFNYPSWSISVEFYTYILFGSVVFISGNKRTLLIWLVVICGISLGALVLLGADGFALAHSFGIVRCLFGFFLGVLTFALYERSWNSSIIANNKRLISYLTLAVVIVFCLFLALKSRGFSDFAIYPLSAAVVLFVALTPSDGPTRFLRTTPFVWLGTISYSIYMVHASVEWGMNQVLRFVTHAEEIQSPLHDTPILETGGTIGLAAVVATVVLVLLISHFTFTWIEKPIRDWSKSAWPTLRARPVLSLTKEDANTVPTLHRRGP